MRLRNAHNHIVHGQLVAAVIAGHHGGRRRRITVAVMQMCRVMMMMAVVMVVVMQRRMVMMMAVMMSFVHGIQLLGIHVARIANANADNHTAAAVRGTTNTHDQL